MACNMKAPYRVQQSKKLRAGGREIRTVGCHWSLSAAKKAAKRAAAFNAVTTVRRMATSGKSATVIYECNKSGCKAVRKKKRKA